ncbi:MAG: hypothetical protein HY880_02390 [Deltaproteobacteria bacterium]|nr:hypothetical protein [Deltaproteobacteria bacterium]
MMPEKTLLERRAFPLMALIPFTMAIAIYLNTLNSSEFIADDVYQVDRNPWTSEPGHLSDMFFPELALSYPNNPEKSSIPRSTGP